MEHILAGAAYEAQSEAEGCIEDFSEYKKESLA
jgi:hypothetical protein